jgi:hypothetical protein
MTTILGPVTVLIPTQNHHMISTDVAGSNDLTKALAESKLFGVNDPANLQPLPSDVFDAYELDVSDHNGRPLASYEDSVDGALNDIRQANPAKWQAAKEELSQIRDGTLGRRRQPSRLSSSGLES